MKTSSGYDNISNKLLKAILPALLTSLEMIFNRALTEGIFPKNMADVVLLFKCKE